MKERTPKRRSIQLKLNALLICSILLVAAGLSGISYYFFCQRADNRYYAMLEHAAMACSNNVDDDLLAYFWSQINTEEFRSLHERAEAAQDEDLIADWLKSKPGWYIFAEDFDADAVDINGETWTLMNDYEFIQAGLLAIQEYFDIDTAYYQYCEGNTTWNIADAREGLLYIGTLEEPMPEFGDYLGNVSIPPTFSKSEFGWLLTVMEPVYDLETMNAIAIAGVDLNMTEIIGERYAFLRQTLAFVAVLLLVTIAVSVAVLRRAALRPLRQLSDGTMRFAQDAREGRAFTKDDVISLDLKNNDEIGDLYREIRSMQSRIVDYTENLTQVTAERERAKTELRTASEIQEAMLPCIFPAFPDRDEFDLYASMTPAKEVGGDFYDFFLVDETHLALVIADVSDKGVPAALFMMASKILLNYRARMGGSPSEILSAVNAEICRNNRSKMFVTVWLGILDLETGVMQCANAGHEYPFVRGKDGSFRVLKDKHGLVVGALARSKYKDYEIQLEPGDAVFVYTDGVAEANNADGAFYGMERLEAALQRFAEQNPQQILEGVKADVDAFTGEASQFDDLTMLCVEYKGDSSDVSMTDSVL